MYTHHHTPAHKGVITTTDPIRGEDIARVRTYLQGRPRDLAIWSVGTQSALRAGDLLSLTWDEMEDDGERIAFLIRERKTQQLRRIRLNPVASADLRAWRRLSNSTFAFSGQRGNALTVAALGRMLKAWAKEAGVSAKRVSSHSLRKTWVRAQHDTHGVPIWVLSEALGHVDEATTRKYMGLLAESVAEAYDNVVA